MSWYSLLGGLVSYVLTIKGYFCNLIGDEDLAGGRVWSSSLECLCGKFYSPSNCSIVGPKWGSLKYPYFLRNLILSCYQTPPNNTKSFERATCYTPLLGMNIYERILERTSPKMVWSHEKKTNGSITRKADKMEDSLMKMDHGSQVDLRKHL